MEYTQIQKAAIACLLIEMANIDNDVAFEELIAINHLNKELKISKETQSLGFILEYEEAIDFLKPLSMEARIQVAKYLVVVADADEKLEPAELDFLNCVCTDLQVKDFLLAYI